MRSFYRTGASPDLCNKASSSDTETSGGWLSFNVVTDNTIHTISAEKG